MGIWWSCTERSEINHPDSNGQTRLHLAVKSGNRKTTEIILQKGANVNVQDCDGTTPLHVALERPHGQAAGLCTLLLEWGANVHLLDKNGRTPLRIASHFSPHCVPLILASIYGINTVNIPDSFGDYPLHAAVGYRDITLLELLLDNGAEIDCKDRNGRTALHWASTCESVLLLLARGAQVNAKDNHGSTPLHTAVQCSTNVEEILLKNGADVNCKDNRGRTPLSFVCTLDIARLLIKWGAEINIQDNNGRSLLHHLANSMITHPTALNEGPTIVNEFLEWGASPTITDCSGRTALEINEEVNECAIKYCIRRHCVNLSKPLEELRIECYQTYHDACIIESEGLKLERYGRHSLYDIFCQINDPQFLSNEALEGAVNDLEGCFPIYSSLLKSTFNKAKVRASLLQSAADTLLTPLPREMIWYVLTMVDDESLRNVLMAKKLFKLSDAQT